MKLIKIIEAVDHIRRPQKYTDTSYRIEMTLAEDGEHTETKILLMYQGKIQGRTVPSYFESDLQTILAEVEGMKKMFEETPELIRKSNVEIFLDQDNNSMSASTKESKGKLKKYIVEYKGEKSDEVSMRVAVWTMVDFYVKFNQPTIEEVKTLFNSPELPTGYYEVVLSEIEYDEFVEGKNDPNERYFTGRKKLRAKDGSLVVSNQWVKATFDRLVNQIIKKDKNFKIYN